MHRYRDPALEEGAPVREQSQQTLGVGVEQEADANRPTEMFEKYNEMLHAGVTITSGRGANKRVEVLSIPFIKKYIQYAKTRIRPVLTQEAASRISEVYVGLRNDDMKGNERKTSPMTVRTLETIIRLATAHAKSRLSNRVEEQDVLAAETILRFALFKEVFEDEKRSKRRKTRPLEDESSSDDDSDSEPDFPESSRAGSSRTPGGTARTRASAIRRNGTNATAHDSDDEDGDGLYNASPRRTTQSSRTTRANGSVPSQSQVSYASSVPASQLQTQSEEPSQEENELASETANLSIAPSITPARFQVFQTNLGQLLNSQLFEDDMAEVGDILQAINRRVGGAAGGAFSRPEAVAALNKLNDQNKIMFSDGEIVYKI